MIKRLAVVLPILSAVAVACMPDKGKVYDTYKVIKNAEWPADSAYRYEFEIQDTSLAYTINLNLRNTISYPFYNLFIDFSLTDSSGHLLKADRPEMQLMDGKTGKPYGNTIGGYYDHNFPLVSGFYFSAPGKYAVVLKQYMRNDPLKEIAAVGIQVIKADASDKK